MHIQQGAGWSIEVTLCRGDSHTENVVQMVGTSICNVEAQLNHSDSLRRSHPASKTLQRNLWPKGNGQHCNPYNCAAV